MMLAGEEGRCEPPFLSESDYAALTVWQPASAPPVIIRTCSVTVVTPAVALKLASDRRALFSVLMILLLPKNAYSFRFLAAPAISEMGTPVLVMASRE